MQNQDWIEMFRVIPPEQHNQIVVVLQNGSELAIDTFFRFEPHFMVARGRVAGTLDENRAFFVPYNQMLYYRIERTMRLEELETIFAGRAETTPPSPETNGTPPAAAVAATVVPAPVPAPAAPADPNAARNALLERIRAARATQSPTVKQPSR